MSICMPTAPPRPCHFRGCPQLTYDGFCDDHKQHKWEGDRYRGTTASRGYDNDWKRVRLLALRRDKFVCQHCLKENRVTVAVDVDHIVPIDAVPQLRLKLDNLQSLCRPCHRAKTEHDRATQRPDTPPIDGKRVCALLAA